MKSSLRAIGMLLVLACGTSGLIAEEQLASPKKKPIKVETAEKKTVRQAQHVPRKTPQMTRTQRNPLPIYVTPDRKMLGLGCASGED